MVPGFEIKRYRRYVTFKLHQPGVLDFEVGVLLYWGLSFIYSAKDRIR